jgi:hypothetical protein
VRREDLNGGGTHRGLQLVCAARPRTETTLSGSGGAVAANTSLSCVIVASCPLIARSAGLTASDADASQRVTPPTR